MRIVWRSEPVISEARALFSLAAPFIIGNLAWSLIAAGNLFLIGHLGSDAVASGALATNLYNAFQIFGMGLATAISPMIARERGQNKYSVREIRRTVRQGMWITAGFCVPIWIALWHAATILLALGQDAVLAAQAQMLLRGLQWALLPYLWFYGLRHFLGAMERPLWGVIITVAALPVNFLLGWCLILGHLGLPRLGLFGAGLASSLTSLAMLLTLVTVIVRDRQFQRFHVFGRFWVADWPRLLTMLRLGAPIAVTFAMEVTVFNASAFLMGTIGRPSLAAHAIANQIAGLCFMVPLGISQASTVRVGIAYGRRDAMAIRRAGWIALGFALAFAMTSALTLAALPRNLIALFLDLHDPRNGEVVLLATKFIYIAGVFQLMDTTQAVNAGLLRGLHDTRYPMTVAVLGYWLVGMGTGYLLSTRTPLAGVGIWIGLATGLAFVALLLSMRWLSRIDRLNFGAGIV